MKNILILSALITFVTSTSSYGVCSLENLNKDKTCTGAASSINNVEESNKIQDAHNNKEDLLKMYQIPTISYPSSMKNSFPILNPSANCAFGMCQPR